MKRSLEKTLRKPLKKTSKKASAKPLKTPPTKLLRKLSNKSSKKPAIRRSMKTSKKPLWIPSEDRVKNANMMRFIEFVNRAYRKKFKTYPELYQWSIDSIPDFWAALWDFVGVKASRKCDQVVDDLEGGVWNADLTIFYYPFSGL